MTEIPEHLLARSTQRRAALTGEGDAGEAAAPVTTESAATPASTGDAAPAPAAAAAPAPEPEPEPEPTPPWVEAHESRKRVPWWAGATLAVTFVFFVLYAFTLDEPTSEEGALALGGEIYGVSCAGCHGGGGGGGSGPALAGGAVVETFPAPVDQVTWVSLGSSGYSDAGFSTYGAQDKPIAGGMPGQVGQLEAAEVMEVVLHERVEYGNEDFDIAVWQEGFEEGVSALLPEQAEEFLAVLEEWEADPPA